MKTLTRAVLALLLSAFPSAPGAASGTCDLPTVKYAGELQSVLSHRAVKAVNLAALRPGGVSGPLDRLVASNASISTGSGDVGIPLKPGSAGLIELAGIMKADTFRFLVWDYIPTPIKNPCGSQKVTVEFINTRRHMTYPVEFTFDHGSIVAAKTWSQSFETGPVAAIPN